MSRWSRRAFDDVDAALRDAGSPRPNASWYFQELLKLGSFDLLGTDALDHVRRR